MDPRRYMPLPHDYYTAQQMPFYQAACVPPYCGSPRGLPHPSPFAQPAFVHMVPVATRHFTPPPSPVARIVGAAAAPSPEASPAGASSSDALWEPLNEEMKAAIAAYRDRLSDGDRAKKVLADNYGGLAFRLTKAFTHTWEVKSTSWWGIVTSSIVYSVDVPAGFLLDGCSLGEALEKTAKKMGIISDHECLAHDWVYATHAAANGGEVKPVTKDDADAIFGAVANAGFRWSGKDEIAWNDSGARGALIATQNAATREWEITKT